MALRGNLKDFSLPDVFQLVTFSRKTGVLRIEREDGALGSVWFRDGDVFFAQSNWHTEPLGERLVRAQRVTPQALAKALELRGAEGEDGRRLGQILVDEGYITEAVLEDFVQEQIQETIFDLMRWDEGEFDFEAMPEAAEEDIGLSVSIENVIMEGSRRLEEWNRIKKKIPSMDVVFKMATAPGEGTFEISLKPMEWNLLLLVDGSRSVAEMAHDTERTDFEVARIVYGLFSAGLLEFATDEEIEKARAERAEREAALAEVRAARKAADEAARAEALEREAALQAEAEARLEAEHAAAEVPVPHVSNEPTEVPEFLGAATGAPTAEDVAVLEEMMGAVLQQPAAPAAEPAPAPEPYVPGEEPAFMSAPVIESEEGVELQLVPVPSVEDLLADIPEFEPESVGLDEALDAVSEAVVAELESGPAPEPVLAEQPAAETEPAAETLAPEPIAAAGSFEPPVEAGVPFGEPPADYAAQVAVEPLMPEPLPVLDELPDALLQATEPAAAEAPPLEWAPPQVGEESPLAAIEAELEQAPAEGEFLEVAEPASESYAMPGGEAYEVPAHEAVFTPAPPTEEAVAGLAGLPAIEPSAPETEVAAAPGEVPDFERDLMALGLGELPSDLLGPVGEATAEPPAAWVPPVVEEAAEQPEPLAPELASLAADLEVSPLVEPQVDVAPAEAAAGVGIADETADFSELLQSLDVDGGEPVADLEEVPTAADFDEELLREVAPPAETGGVISTDAFLEDITIDEMGFSGGMTDELSALTGADRPARPTTSVNKIPDANAEGVLHRDARVDKDTLLKIIDGIKNL